MSALEGLKKWYAKHFKTDVPIAYIIGFIMLVIPFLRPFGLPIPIGEHSQLLYDWIEGEQPGNVYVLMGHSDFALSTYPECGYAGEANIMHLIDKEVKFVIVAQAPACVAAFNFMMENIRDDIEARGYVYGTDWVYIYIEISVDAKVAFSKDFTTTGTDVYGANLDDMPIIDYISKRSAPYDVADLNDASGIIGYAMLAHAYYTIPWTGADRQWNGYLPSMLVSFGCQFATNQAYYPDLYLSVIASTVGSAEYCLLRGDLRWPVKAVDVVSTLLLVGLGFMIIGNIRQHWGKLTGGE